MVFSRVPLLRSCTLLCVLAAATSSGCAPTSGRVGGTLSEQTLAGVALRQVDGKALDLQRIIATHEATVLVWWATRCPCVKRYQQRIEGLRQAFPTDRVAIVAIASNADDDASTLARNASARRMRTPLAMDPAAKLARVLGVQTTPTTVVLDRRGQVVFHGWIDNERAPGESGREPYAKQAILATLANRQPQPQRTPVYGCMITKRVGETQRCLPAPQVETCHADHE